MRGKISSRRSTLGAVCVSALLALSSQAYGFSVPDTQVLETIPEDSVIRTSILNSFILTDLVTIQEEKTISISDPRLNISINSLVRPAGTYTLNPGDTVRLRVKLDDTGLADASPGSVTLLPYTVSEESYAWNIVRANPPSASTPGVGITPFQFGSTTTSSGSTVESDEITLSGVRGEVNAFLTVPSGAFTSATSIVLNGQDTGQRAMPVTDGDRIRVKTTLPFLPSNGGQQPDVDLGFILAVGDHTALWNVTSQPPSANDNVLDAYMSNLSPDMQNLMLSMEISLEVQNVLIYDVPPSRLENFMADNPEMTVLTPRVARTLADATPDSLRPYGVSLVGPTAQVDTYSFAPRLNEPLSEFVESNEEMITPQRSGADVGEMVQLTLINAVGSPEYATSEDGVDWTDWDPLTTGSEAEVGHFIKLRILTPGSHSSLHFVTFTIGTGAANWQVTTGFVPPAIEDFDPIEDAPLSTVIESDSFPIVENAPVPILASVDGEGDPEFRVSTDDGDTWGNWSPLPKPVRTDDQVQIRLTSHEEEDETHTAFVTLENPGGGGDPQAMFEVTTGNEAEPPEGGLSLGRAGSCIAAGGTAYCWGMNSGGSEQTVLRTTQHSGSQSNGFFILVNQQGGYGTPNFDLTPQPIPEQVASVVTSGYHSCALSEAGNAWCWGNNAQGQLGRGTTSAMEPVPALVNGLTDLVKIDMASSEPAYHTCAVRSDGTVWCWGSAHMGRLGHGNSNGVATTPVQVLNINDAIDVSVSAYHACALRENGRVSCWGGNANGAVRPTGTQNPFDSVGVNTPFQRTDVTDAVSLSVNVGRSCVIRADTNVWCWGQGEYPDNTFSYGSAHGPTAWRAPNTNFTASELTGMTQIDIGARFHSCGVRDDGTVWCWGSNRSGMLGLADGTMGSAWNSASNQTGTIAQRQALVNQVPGLPGPASRVATGGEYACAEMEADGAIWCWGKNYGMGEFGRPGPDPEPITITTTNPCAWQMNGVCQPSTQTSTVNFTSTGSDGAERGFNPDPHRIAFWPRDFSVPHEFAFNSITGAPVGEEVISDPATITGMTEAGATVDAAISGTGSPEFRINGGDWVSAGTLENGDTVEVRLTSAPDFRETRMATLDMEGIEAPFTVTTSGPPAPENLTLQAYNITQAVYNDLNSRGAVCTGAYAAGSTVDSATYLADSRLTEVEVNGETRTGCVTNLVMQWGIIFNSATFTYATW